MRTMGVQQITSPQQLKDFIDFRQEEIIRTAKAFAEKTARDEVKLAEFELLYASVVSKTESEKNLRLLKADRAARWEKALKAAGGDEEKALFIYDDA